MWTKRAFNVKKEAFYIIFKGFSTVKNRLRPESGPLRQGNGSKLDLCGITALFDDDSKIYSLKFIFHCNKVDYSLGWFYYFMLFHIRKRLQLILFQVCCELAPSYLTK